MSLVSIRVRAIRSARRDVVQGAAGDRLPVLHCAARRGIGSKEGKIDSKAEFIITMDWPDNHPDDLDLFVQDPAGNIAWYRHREAGFLTLDRDDRGGANDFIVVNGKKIPSPIGRDRHRTRYRAR